MRDTKIETILPNQGPILGTEARKRGRWKLEAEAPK
jgi:hypothetical protein